MFSVVIPLYNKAPHIEGTLRSVLLQEFPAAEIIVVDDGSTDGGDVLVTQFHDQGVILIRQKNQGVSAARNNGVAAANSPYIAFLDADDHWLPSHLMSLRELIEQVPNHGLYSTMHQVCVSGKLFVHRSVHRVGFAGTVEDFFSIVLKSPAIVHTSAACVDRKYFQSVGGFPVDVRYYEDFILWIKLSVNFGFAHIAKITAVYNCDSVNRSTRLRGREKLLIFEFLRRLIDGDSLHYSDRHSANLLAQQILFRVTASMKLSADHEGLIAAREYFPKPALSIARLKFCLLMLTPVFVLKFFHMAREFYRKIHF